MQESTDRLHAFGSPWSLLHASFVRIFPCVLAAGTVGVHLIVGLQCVTISTHFLFFLHILASALAAVLVSRLVSLFGHFW